MSTFDRFASCMIPADDVARFQEIQEIAAKARTQSQNFLTCHATCGLCQAGVRQGQVRKHLVEAKEQMMDIEAQTSPSSPSVRRQRLLLVQGKVRLKEEEDEAAEKARIPCSLRCERLVPYRWVAVPEDRLEKKRLAEKRCGLGNASPLDSASTSDAPQAAVVPREL